VTSQLEQSRTEFADEVITRASKCSNNAELVQQLEQDFHCELIGVGSTRRVYAAPCGVVVKVQREHLLDDPQEDDGGGDRGGFFGLSWSRRMANISELMFATSFPRLMPRQYGFLASFGITQAHPSVLIAETARTLDLFLPGDGTGIQTENMGLDADGHLWVFDPRLSPATKPDGLAPCTCDESAVWLGNIGVIESGHFVFTDRSRNARVDNLLDSWTLCPKAWGSSPSNSPAQTLEFSRNLFLEYQRAAINQKG
jgi:hypothetical protein